MTFKNRKQSLIMVLLCLLTVGGLIVLCGIHFDRKNNKGILYIIIVTKSCQTDCLK